MHSPAWRSPLSNRFTPRRVKRYDKKISISSKKLKLSFDRGVLQALQGLCTADGCGAEKTINADSLRRAPTGLSLHKPVSESPRAVGLVDKAAAIVRKSGSQPQNRLSMTAFAAAPLAVPARATHFQQGP